MMKRFPTILVATIFTLAGMTSCSPGKKAYEDALDADREAREKMTAAQGLMRDVATIQAQAGDELTEAEKQTIETKRAEALDAFKVAQESWADAIATYEQLIADHPEEPVYLNNLANLIYNKSFNGLEADLTRARSLLDKALGMADREIFKRNLELIDELGSNVDTMKTVEDNRAIVAELRRLAAEHN
jgi:hypothetical protein